MEDDIKKIIDNSIRKKNKSLNLSNLGLAIIPNELFELHHLEEINLSNNRIQEIPKEIVNLKNLRSLIIHNNPISNLPIEIIDLGVNAIKQYFIQLENIGINSLYESKILIIGEGGAGKTTLARRITNLDALMPEENETTKGIEVSSFEFPIDEQISFKANIWDFGGQEIYHATHQFFLTKRSLYILVTDSRKEDVNLNYWLNIVEVLGGNSPVIILINEKQDRVKDINEFGIKSKYDNVKEIHHANLLTKRGLPELIQSIKYHLSQLPHIGAILPKVWIDIRRHLESLNKNYISYSEYLSICQENNLKDIKSASYLSNYLHDLGVFLHFQENLILTKIIILRPEWTTAAVYKILDDYGIQQKNGEFGRKDLQKLFNNSEYEYFQVEVLELMKMFELCYELPIGNTFIFPQLLPAKPPKYEFDEKRNILLKYKYSILPRGILARFIVRMHRYIYGEVTWKNGVVLKRKNTFAEVLEMYGENEIQIRVNGEQSRELLTIIIEEVDMIHYSFQNLKVQKLIPCFCNVCQKEEIPTFYDYDSLLKRLEKGKYTVECYKSYEDISVKALVGEIGMSKKEGDDIFNSVLKNFGIKPDSLEGNKDEK